MESKPHLNPAETKIFQKDGLLNQKLGQAAMVSQLEAAGEHREILVEDHQILLPGPLSYGPRG